MLVDKRLCCCGRDAFVCTDHQYLHGPYQNEGGTTACVAILLNGTVTSLVAQPETRSGVSHFCVCKNRKVVVGNVGDSRAVLNRGGQAVALSMDHTPSRQDEGALSIYFLIHLVANWQRRNVS